jgi:hypothetical protein
MLGRQAGFETFSANPKPTSLRAFLTVSTHTSTLVALLSSLVASTAESNPPTVTNLIAYTCRKRGHKRLQERLGSES